MSLRPARQAKYQQTKASRPFGAPVLSQQDLWREVERQQREIEKLREQLTERDRRIAEGEKQLSDASKQIAEREKQIADAEKQIADLERQLAGRRKNSTKSSKPPSTECAFNWSVTNLRSKRGTSCL